MTEEQQIIAIAESLGWDCDPLIAQGWVSRGEWVLAPNDQTVVSRKYLPDFLNDLNAMREVLSTMSNDEAERYELVLLDVLVDHETHEFTWFAEAHFHAEAYLRTKGLWEGEGV